MNGLPEPVARTPLFSLLSEKQRDEVARVARRREFQKGELIALYGDIWPYLLVVGEGTLNAVKESSGGRRLIVLTLEPGDVFWGPAFFNDGASMPVTIEARRASRVYLWDRESLLPVLLKNGPALWELCRLMVVRMQQASEIVEGLAFRPVAVRLARFIIERFGDSANTPVARDLTLDEMAAMVGTTREQVCRILYRFASEGLIKITRTEFVLTDKDSLSRLIE
ncbi:MAG TPA: Crp/Fnr family transcriptional regulator [Chloroflexi bacterium]|nr:Crp/Fnr family transcriptional regulator [Chloroflexota bacterium]